MKVQELMLLLGLASTFNFARGDHPTAGGGATYLVGHRRRSSPDPSTSTRKQQQQQQQQQRPNHLKIRRERRDGYGAHGHGHGELRTPLPVQAAAAALSSVVGNATQALVPFAPLLVEAPTLAAHARRAWPWLRAAATRRPFPFAFVSSPAPLPQRRQGALRNNHNRDAAPLRRRPARAEGARCAVCSLHRRRFALAEDSEAVRNGGFDADCRCRCSGNAASPDGIGAGTCRASSGGHGGGGVISAVNRRGAIGEVVSLVGRWGAASAGLAVVGGGGAAASAAAAGDGTGKTGARGGGAGEEGGFGSKTYTEKSYDGFADGYDDLDGGWAASAIGVEDLRSQLLARAGGRVLEVGVGTGLNLRHYPRDRVTSIDGVDLSPGMLSQASARSGSLGMRGLVRLQQMDVEDLKFPSGAFDTVVDTFSLCVFSDPSAALREMTRVCKPTGRVLLLENSKSGFGPLAAYQDLTASYLADRGGAKGCFWNQDVEALARGAGLRVEHSSPALPGGLFRTLECVPA